MWQHDSPAASPAHLPGQVEHAAVEEGLVVEGLGLAQQLSSRVRCGLPAGRDTDCMSRGWVDGWDSTLHSATLTHASQL